MLRLAARQGRLLLVAGLVMGASWPAAAAALRPYLPHMIAVLLGLSAFRIGGRLSIGSGAAMRRAGLLVAGYQIAAPLALLAIFALLGASEAVFAIALVLMLAAPSLTGSPNFTVLLGHDPAMALRMLLLGTGLLPFTAWPILSLMPGLASSGDVLAACLRLLVVIGGTVGLAFALRRWVGEARATALRPHIDGLSAILLAVLVVGLMTSIGPALRTAPLDLLGWMALAVGANFGLQIVAWIALRPLPPQERAAAAFIAGNRNMALFLVALPAPATDALLMFIGCYQVPMYLTPFLLGWLYRRI